MKTAITPELIRKYIGGACTTEEFEAVNQWYTSFEQAADPVIDLELKEQLELKMRMLGQIRTNIKSVSANRRNKRMKLLLYGWCGSAAAAVIALVWLTFYKHDFIKTQRDRSASRTNISAVSLIRNTTKGIEKHVLSDGSIIWLNPGAHIMYNKGFASKMRSVQLSGDAFFEVTKDKKRPFVIHSHNLITTVWGTSFSITYNKSNQAMEVAVLTGKVSVRDAGHKADEVMLLPNEKAVYQEKGHQLGKAELAPNSAINMWKKEDVSFDNTAVNEVVKVLNLKFDVNITIADDALDAYVLKADFTDQSLPEILLMMQKSLNITYAIDGKHIELRQQEQ
uniref:FecR family protein n=1 Tax=Pedobacter schmidteae TaxID=2201271 RepID=UPI000EAD2590|nr:FecR domain-containing protein [Pedobacter schmidteae]